jgi:hypothetical protein
VRHFYIVVAHHGASPGSDLTARYFSSSDMSSFRFPFFLYFYFIIIWFYVVHTTTQVVHKWYDVLVCFKLSVATFFQ